MSREKYIEYFAHMQDEDQKSMLGDNIGWHIHGAVDEDKVFTQSELADMFPKLLRHIRKENE